MSQTIDYHVDPIPAFTDNYIWCLHNQHTAYVVDPGDPAPVQAFLQQQQLQLAGILITHHHRDHTGGIESLLASHSGIRVIGPANSDINGINVAVDEGDTIELGEFDVNLQVIRVPGHTLDHIAYHDQQSVFCGDTLFSAGCGRLFEGTYEQLWSSLQKIRALPCERIYCTHEYTLANLKFAQHIDTNNPTLDTYSHWCNKRREMNLPTLPTTMSMQRQINPFLRADEPSLQQAITAAGGNINNELDAFTWLRQAKDRF